MNGFLVDWIIKLVARLRGVPRGLVFLPVDLSGFQNLTGL